MSDAKRSSGQAVPLVLAIVAAASALTVVGLGVERLLVSRSRVQTIADVAALAAARAEWEGRGRRAAEARAALVAAANGEPGLRVLPVRRGDVADRIRVELRSSFRIGSLAVPFSVTSAAEVADWLGGGVSPGPGDYPGPFSWRQGKPMRPDVALAFDRMAAAAAAAGHVLAIVSAWRSTAEQALLFAAHPDPKWVAPPGRSLHRLGTELDLGPDSNYAWLAANSTRFGFARRYAWEPWHFGLTRSPGTTSVGFGRRKVSGGALQPWVPGRFRQAILVAARRRGVSAALLAAQIRAESDFNPSSVSSAGAQGISQLMPDESRRFRVDPFSPAEAIDAQAQLMRELLARFAAVPLALAAYNAGPGAVARYGGIPPFAETRAYVTRILGWLRGAQAGPIVRLVA